VEISLEKTSCYGPCPVYAVYIYGDGTILYEGVENVRVIGERSNAMHLYSNYPAEVIELVDEIDRIAGTQKWVGDDY
jgi:hypothetical protein